MEENFDQNQIGAAEQQVQSMQQKQMMQNAKDFVCSCGGRIFEEKLMFKKLSPLMTQSGKEEFVPMRIIVCTSCGLVPNEFDSENVIPKEAKTTSKDNSQ